MATLLMCLLCRRYLIQSKSEFAFKKQSQGWRGESWEGPRTQPQPGLDYNYSMTGCHHVMFPFFPFSWVIFLNSCLVPSKYIKANLKRADQECGPVCCVQHWPTPFHKERETMWITFRNRTSEQILQHFPSGEKKYILVPGVLHYAWQKLKMR